MPLQEYANFVLWIGEGDDRFLRFDGTIAVVVGHVVSSTKLIIGIDVTITAVSDAIGATCLMMEIAGLSDVITVAIGVLTG